MQIEVECSQGCGRRGLSLSMGTHSRSCWNPRTLERLLELGAVDTTDPSVCWRWKKRDDYSNYPSTAHGPVHRLIAALEVGRELRRGELACHTCDVHWCVNPGHIYVGTYRDNHADAVRNGLMHYADSNVISERMRRQWARGAMDSVRSQRTERVVVRCSYCDTEIQRLPRRVRVYNYCRPEHFYAHRKVRS